jgi:hypothetical protein
MGRHFGFFYSIDGLSANASASRQLRLRKLRANGA